MKSFAIASAVLALAVSLSWLHRRAIALTPQTEQRLQAQAPIRFLLTFDDAPAPRVTEPEPFGGGRPGAQPGVAGNQGRVFLQTEAARSGGSSRGARPWSVSTRAVIFWRFTRPPRSIPTTAG